MILFVVLVHRRAGFQAFSKNFACRIVTAEKWRVAILMLLAKIWRIEALYSTGTAPVATEVGPRTVSRCEIIWSCIIRNNVFYQFLLYALVTGPNT